MGQDPIGLRIPVSLRDLLLGTVARVSNLKNNIDGGNYTSTIKKELSVDCTGVRIETTVYMVG